MKKITAIILVCLYVLNLNAGDTIINQKKCERIQLSIKVDLVSCSNKDYLIEYRSEDEVRGEVVKVTAITGQNAKVIKSK